MKSHLDPLLKKQVLHSHDLEDISGIYSVAAGNLGAIDAHLGTEESPVDPPVSDRSGFWIVNVKGYIDINGVSTLCEAGDFVTYDLDSDEYGRVDNKILDATLDISSVFTNSLNDPALVNQKLVNERLDIYVPPAGGAGIVGAIPYWDGAKRVNSDPTKWKWDPATETMSFGNSGKVTIGEQTISRLSTTRLRFSQGIDVIGGGSFGGEIITYGAMNVGTNITLINKATSGWLNFATRNTSGAEAVYDLGYVGNITMPYASTISTTAGVLSILSSVGNLLIGTETANDIRFKSSGAYRWVIESGGTYRPYATNTYDIGSSSYKVKDIYAEGKIYIGGDVNLYRSAADVLKTDDSLYISGYVYTTNYLQTTQALYHGTNIYVRNKANTNDLAWFTRNTAGAEVVGDLSYIGNITMPYASTIKTSAGTLTLWSYDNLNFKAGSAGTTRWYIKDSTGNLVPNGNNAYDIGTPSEKVKDGYFAGIIYTGGINVATQTPASAAATGTAGTITWDADFLYVCIAANTWKRAALSTW